jgi:hypothetical protein
VEKRENPRTCSGSTSRWLRRRDHAARPVRTPFSGDVLLRQRECWAFGPVGTAYVMLSSIAVLAMEPAGIEPATSCLQIWLGRGRLVSVGRHWRSRAALPPNGARW